MFYIDIQRLDEMRTSKGYFFLGLIAREMHHVIEETLILVSSLSGLATPSFE